MRRRACVVLTAINLIMILINIIVISAIYKGVYRTHLFWGINLYVFTSSILMIVNRKETSSFIYFNTALTLVSFIWLVLYAPKYTPDNAVGIIKTQSEFSKAKNVYIDKSNPVSSEGASGRFVKGGYNIIADYGDGNRTYIVFNPMNGKYSTSEDKTATLPHTILQDEFTDDDELFMEQYNAAKGDPARLKVFLIEYRNKFAEDVKTYYNNLLAELGEDEKEQLKDDQSNWMTYITGHNNFIQSVYSKDEMNNYNSELMEIESMCYNYRSRARALKYMYERISGEQ